MDHDQRNTLNAGFTANLPLHTWFASNVYYGSGFTNGLANSGLGPIRETISPSTPHSTSRPVTPFGELGSFPLPSLNVTNHRVLLDNSITIGGFHFNDPRMFSAELRYRFRF